MNLYEDLLIKSSKVVWDEYQDQLNTDQKMFLLLLLKIEGIKETFEDLYEEIVVIKQKFEAIEKRK